MFSDLGHTEVRRQQDAHEFLTFLLDKLCVKDIALVSTQSGGTKDPPHPFLKGSVSMTSSYIKVNNGHWAVLWLEIIFFS